MNTNHFKILKKINLILNEVKENDLTMERGSGSNDASFGKDWKGACIRIEHYDYIGGLFFIEDLDKCFIRLINQSSGICYSAKLETSKGLKSSFMAVALDGKCRVFPKDLILKGLKA